MTLEEKIIEGALYLNATGQDAVTVKLSDEEIEELKSHRICKPISVANWMYRAGYGGFNGYVRFKGDYEASP